jgi:hypothetical protein
LSPIVGSHYYHPFSGTLTVLKMNFQQQQQLAMAQQMSAQYGGGMTPQQQQQIAMAQQMSAQYGGGMTPQQQQQVAMAQQMSAQYGGGMTPQQQQQVAMAQQMSAQYGGGMTPQQQQQMAFAQQQQGGGPPGYAPPQAPMAAASSNDSTVVTVTFPDGCMIGWDRLRNELIMNGKTSNTRMRQMPARPLASFSTAGSYAKQEEEEVVTPVEKQGMMTKLGWKKTVLGSDSWQSRFFKLTDTHLSYAKDASSPAINSIALNNGIVVNVINAATAARKNRYLHLHI